jgi:hypothetical protein
LTAIIGETGLTAFFYEFTEMVATLDLALIVVLNAGEWELELAGDRYREEMLSLFFFTFSGVLITFSDSTSSVWVSACAFSTKRAFFSSLSSV